jgi:hypothetical protein
MGQLQVVIHGFEAEDAPEVGERLCGGIWHSCLKGFVVLMAEWQRGLQLIAGIRS